MSAVLNAVTEQFLHTLQGDFDKIQHAGKSLFFQLATIQIAISGLFLALKGDINTFFVKIVQITFVMSVFYTAILFGGEWMPSIINSFIDIGAQAGGISSLTPSSIIDQGFSIGSAMIDNFGSWGWVTHPFGALMAATLLIMIVILYALIAAELVIIMIKSYILISLSGLFYAFGALEITRPIAMNYFKSVIGIGMQLLAIYLILGVGQQIGSNWADMIKQAASDHELMPFLVVAATVIVYYLIVKNVPPFIAGLTGISGFRSYGDEAVGSAITAGATTVNTMTRAASMSSQGLGKLATGGNALFQVKKGGGSLKHMAGNLGEAMSHAASQHFRGENKAATFGQKVNQNLHTNLKNGNSVSNQAPYGTTSAETKPVNPSHAPPASGNAVKSPPSQTKPGIKP